MTDPDPTDLPDLDDSLAVAAWVQSIEREASRIGLRHQLVMTIATASHDIFMHKTRPLPLWATPADRIRAYVVLLVGMVLVTGGAIAVRIIDPQRPTGLLLFLIACLVWFFLATYEVARNLRNRSKNRLERDAQIRAATVRRDTAAALLKQHGDQQRPTR